MTYDDLDTRRSLADTQMTVVYLGFLRKGPTWTAEVTPALEQLQQAHLDNIGRLAGLGKLALAGPILDEADDLRGIFVFTTDSLVEARALADSDPSIAAGRLVLELRPWMIARDRL